MQTEVNGINMPEDFIYNLLASLLWVQNRIMATWKGVGNHMPEEVMYFCEDVRDLLVGVFKDCCQLANPLIHPRYFCEDVWDLLVNTYKDCCLFPPVVWYCFYMFIAYRSLQFVRRARRDYLDFLGLGRGGRPSNVWGWLINKFYHFLLVKILDVDVLSKPFIHPLMEPYNGFLWGIPRRMGPRPEIIGMGPMRQRTDVSPRLVMEWITGRFVNLGLNYPERLRFQRSFLTGLPALVRHLQEAAPNGTPNAVTEWGAEIAHVRADGSTTVHLHPSDANEVIQCGWGQRNPLAVMHEVWLWRFIYHWILRTHTPLSRNMVIIYSPWDGSLILGKYFRFLVKINS